MSPIEHHMMIQQQINEMAKAEIVTSLPKMKHISLVKIKADGSHVYDASRIHGTVLLRLVCADGLVLVIQEEND